MRVLFRLCWLGWALAVPVCALAARLAPVADVSGEASGAASRMVFKENTKKKEAACQLTLMHVYTSKFNKKFTQFAFTGSVLAQRSAGKPMTLTVIGQNHQLGRNEKDIKPFSIPRIELGVEDVSVRRFTDAKAKCKKSHVCVHYKDTAKHELQTWVGDEAKNMHLLFPLVTKQPTVVMDLSKFPAAGKDTSTPLAQFKNCTAHLR